MLGKTKVIAFLATTNGERARRFYEGTLGLVFVEDSPFALVFDAGTTMLRIQKEDKLTPHPFTALGWEVPDVEAAVNALIDRGVTFERPGFIEQDALGVWTAPDGTRVAWFKDPDGNTLSLSEHRPRA